MRSIILANAKTIRQQTSQHPGRPSFDTSQKSIRETHKTAPNNSHRKRLEVDVKKWAEDEEDPSPFFISDDCMTLLKQWENSSDPSIIKQLETNTCISQENKIRFVGMILVNYLNMLDQNAYNESHTDQCIILWAAYFLADLV